MSVFFAKAYLSLRVLQVDPDKAFAVQIAHEENVVTTNVAYMQCALLYTSSNGERRIRLALFELLPGQSELQQE